VIPLLPEELVELLARMGLYDTAFSLASAFDQDLSPIFSDLVLKYLKFSDQGLLSDQQRTSIPIVWTDTIVSPYESADRRLDLLLQKYLELYDSAKTHFSYHKVVVEKLLSSEKQISLPNWLLKPYTIQLNQKTPLGSPQDLLNAYVKYGRLQEAKSCALQYISQVKQALPNQLEAGKLCSPYSAFDRLLVALDSPDRVELQEEIEKFIELLRGKNV